jgi:hypothetical protein
VDTATIPNDFEYTILPRPDHQFRFGLSVIPTVRVPDPLALLAM